MDRIDSLRFFVRVVETNNFSRAARMEGVGQSTISKHIAGLEARLGTQLLRRTSRGLSLTAAGEAYYARALDLLARYDELDRPHGHGELAGHLRVALPAAFGRLHVLPRLASFLAAHPNLTVDTFVSDRFVNLVEDGIDLAIRIGRLADSSLVARRIGSAETALVAGAGLIAAHGMPATPADLGSLPSIGFLIGDAVRPWSFSGAGELVPAATFRTNDAEQVRTAVLDGLGLAQAPVWLFRDELESGRIVRLLPAYDPPPVPIHAVTPSGRVQSPGVRSLVDHIADGLAADPLLRPR